MDADSAAMEAEEQLPIRIDSRSKPKADSVFEPEDSSVEAPHPTPTATNTTTTTMAESDEEDDDLLIPSFVMPSDDDYYADGAIDEMDRGKPEAQLARERAAMASEEMHFARFRSYWQHVWGKTAGSSSDLTTLSSMQSTHLIPGGGSRHDVGTETTLQVFTLKLADLKGGFGWPLSVYGLVAARDPVDRNRNLLFFRDWSQPQELTQDDPFLRLIGPSRAIVLDDPVVFEIQLKVRRGAKPDRALITEAQPCHGFGPGVSTLSFDNCFCTAELCLEEVRGTVQATILGVRVVKDGGAWPFGHGSRVACSPITRKMVFPDSDEEEDGDCEITHVTHPSSGEIVLLDSKDGATAKGSRGYLCLSRQVVSVQLCHGMLEVAVEAYSPSGGTAARGRVCFEAKDCQISQGKCLVGDAEVEITVAWSLLVEEKQDIAAPDFLDGF